MLEVLRRRRSWPEWAFFYLRVFRVVVVGTCLVVAVGAWFAQIDWLLKASICIAIGEFLESSYYIVVLKWGERTGRTSAPAH